MHNDARLIPARSPPLVGTQTQGHNHVPREPEAPIHQPARHRGNVRHFAAQATRVGDTIWVSGQLGIDVSRRRDGSAGTSCVPGFEIRPRSCLGGASRAVRGDSSRCGSRLWAGLATVPRIDQPSCCFRCRFCFCLFLCRPSLGFTFASPLWLLLLIRACADFWGLCERPLAPSG